MDANQDTGADIAESDALSDSDDLNRRLAELIDNDNAAVEGSDEGADDGQPDDADPEVDSEPLYTVKVDGKDVQVKQSELLQGYQRDADYRNKTKEVAEQRRAVEAEYSAVSQERQQAIQVLQHYQQQLAQTVQPNIDWEGLLQNDPAEYLRQRHSYDMKAAEFSRAQQMQAQLQMQTQNEQQQHFQQYVKSESEALAQALPEFRDAVKSKAAKEAIKGYLKDAGFDDAAIGSVADHKMIVIADKARRYDALMKNAAQTTKRVQSVPARVERPGNAESRAPDNRSSASQQFRKSGSVDDAARLISQMNI
jgi:hypothetical protein